MGDVLIGLILGLVLALVLAIGWRRLRRGRAKGPRITVQTSLEKFRSIGELSVYRLVAKEIVTAQDHWVGDFGEKYLSWLVTPKRLAMIFEFDVEFRYDLRDPAFAIDMDESGRFTVRMPRCTYEISIRDMAIYDEQQGRLMSWLLPGLVSDAIGDRFNPATKNRMKDEAVRQVRVLAERLVRKLEPEVQGSARQTMRLLARGFDAGVVGIDFTAAEPAAAGAEVAVEGEKSA